MKKILTLLTLMLVAGMGYAQRFPGDEQNMEYLVNFGRYAQTDWGDDDFSQVVFVTVPSTRTEPFYIRVFDPSSGGMYDEMQGVFNTNTRFSVVGGKGAYSNPDARETNPVRNYKSGVVLDYKDFGAETEYDGVWYSFGPFSPRDGEFSKEYNAYVFKVVVEGIAGDDGNLYHFFASSDRESNKPLEGGYLFAYEICFRMNTNPNSISHFYPYINNERTIGFSVYNFDYDNGGNIHVFSVSKNGQPIVISKNKEWQSTRFSVTEKERLSAIDIQLYNYGMKNNNVTFYCVGEDNVALPMYSVPIGGIPIYVYTPRVRYKKVNK